MSTPVTASVEFSGDSPPAQELLGSADYDQDVLVTGLGFADGELAIGFSSTVQDFMLPAGPSNYSAPVKFVLPSGTPLYAIGPTNAIISALATQHFC